MRPEDRRIKRWHQYLDMEEQRMHDRIAAGRNPLTNHKRDCVCRDCFEAWLAEQPRRV